MNRLYFGDNLKVLREHVPDESVDLIYLDPPFNSNATYNVLFAEKSGEKSTAQITAFDDTWHWGKDSEATFQEIVTGPHTKLASLIEALRGFLGTNDMMAYLTMMAIRLVELRRVLKPTGSIYLHCDPTASHYLKLVMDAVFGPLAFRNEIIWKRSSAHSSSRRYSPVHDAILLFAKGESPTWNPYYSPLPQETADAWYNNVEPETGRRFNRADLTAAGKRAGPSGAAWRGIDPTAKGRHWAIPGFVKEVVAGKSTADALDALDAAGRLFWPKAKSGVPMLKRYLDEARGLPPLDVITDINPLNNVAAERLGYPTQKPEALLERFIHASSDEGDLVLDPFCGCGTAVAVAEKIGRRWIGIDITHLAIALMRNRLQTAFGAALSPYEVIGDPKDLESAAALAVQDRYQFEWWALGLVDAWPAQDKKKGADTGIDGYISFFDDNSGKAKRIIVQVKSGHVGAAQVRDLKGTIERERAAIGVLVTLEEPTKPMKTEAVSAGFYDSEHFKGEYQRLQILTIRALLAGAKVRFPQMGMGATFKAAPKKHRGEQQELF